MLNFIIKLFLLIRETISSHYNCKRLAENIIIVRSLDMIKISNPNDKKIKFKFHSWLYKKLKVPIAFGMLIECPWNIS